MNRRSTMAMLACAATLTGPATAQYDPAKPHLPWPIWNRSPGSVWVTVYEVVNMTPQALATGCVQPHHAMWINGATRGNRNYLVQAELTMRPNCQQPVACTTRMSYELKPGRVIWMDFRSNPDNCWWEQADDTDTKRRRLPDKPYMLGS